ncbi:MAG: class I SAM-dependent methyltransferase [Pyramidobacter sp.]|nr:class I SAM-dependent methyltransferase [Pyramidobacter sp.]
MNSSKKADYGNWVPRKLMNALWGVFLGLLFLAVLNALLWRNSAAALLLGAFSALSLAAAAYMQYCRRTVDLRGGGLSGKFYDELLDHLAWQGRGRLLDIGCGSGALSIRCAQRFPAAQIIGVDYWSDVWDYSQKQCEENARLEGCDARIGFRHGDAARLEFADESFDAAVSCFVFHEVKTISGRSKRPVVEEALRVLKKGGSFAFIDLFGRSALYGDMEEFVQRMKDSGLREVNYIPRAGAAFVPALARPMMTSGVGLLYGVK